MGFGGLQMGKKLLMSKWMKAIYQSIEFYTKEKILVGDGAQEDHIDILLLEQETQR